MSRQYLWNRLGPPQHLTLIQFFPSRRSMKKWQHLSNGDEQGGVRTEYGRTVMPCKKQVRHYSSS
eukprot:scaffold101_cov123-Cylindrotheca_fusiformis.AAC.11